MNIPSDLPNLIHYAVPFFVITILIEVIVITRLQVEKYKYKDMVTSISMGLGNLFIGLVSKGFVFVIFMFIYNFKHNISTTTLQNRYLNLDTKRTTRNKNQSIEHLPTNIK